MALQVPAIVADDLRPGGTEWLASPIRLGVTWALGVVAAAAVGTALIASVASWPRNRVVLNPDIVAMIGWASGLLALLWLAGNLLRLLPLEQRWIYNAVDRRNVSITLLMFGIVRPTPRSMAAVAGVVAVAAVVVFGGLHFGAFQIDTRVHQGLFQIDPDEAGDWTTVTATAYRHAQGAAVRAAANFGVVPASIALLAAIGQLRLRVAGGGVSRSVALGR